VIEPWMASQPPSASTPTTPSEGIAVSAGLYLAVSRIIRSRDANSLLLAASSRSCSCSSWPNPLTTRTPPMASSTTPATSPDCCCASQLAGTIRAAGTGGPLAGVTVTLANTRGEVVAACSTDAHGRYLITDLAAGRYALALSAPAYQPAALPVTVADGDATTQDADLRSGARVRGTARTTAGDAIPDARVMLLDGDGNVAGLARTGDDGGYSFENLPEGDYTVVASGYPPAASRLRVSSGEAQAHDVQLGHPEV